jgi:protoporphyrin/coproporphyrin ferrochelatase
MARLAVVMFNLGGPDQLAAVEPFLFNLFNDRAIIGLPQPWRRMLAWFVARRRAPVAREIYGRIGGGSPLLTNTIAQARALEQKLGDMGEVRAFPCMRYWHPMAPAVARDVAAFKPDGIVLLPLYPQFSSTTTASSYDSWRQSAAAAGLHNPGRLICCYPGEPGFVNALAGLVRKGIQTAADAAHRPLRVLFSAHGLPKRIVERGDPYPAQVARTAQLVAKAAGLIDGQWVICYQSRVGPLEWIGPSTDEEIRRAGSEGTRLVVVPIAFVSEHSETLVELDMEYGHLAAKSGVPVYVRVPTVGTEPEFIEGLANMVRAAMGRQEGEISSVEGSRICSVSASCCLMQQAGR